MEILKDQSVGLNLVRVVLTKYWRNWPPCFPTLVCSATYQGSSLGFSTQPSPAVTVVTAGPQVTGEWSFSSFFIWYNIVPSSSEIFWVRWKQLLLPGGDVSGGINCKPLPNVSLSPLKLSSIDACCGELRLRRVSCRLLLNSADRQRKTYDKKRSQFLTSKIGASSSVGVIVSISYSRTHKGATFYPFITVW